MGLRSSHWRAAQRAELAEARAASDARTLSERTEDAVALLVLTVVELARRAKDRDELADLLARQEPLPSMRERWDALHPRSR